MSTSPRLLARLIIVPVDLLLETHSSPFVSPQVLLVVFGVIQAITKLDIGVVGDFSSLIKQFHRCVRNGLCVGEYE